MRPPLVAALPASAFLSPRATRVSPTCSRPGGRPRLLSSRWRVVDTLPLFLELVHHFRGQFAGRRVPGKFIGGWEEETFERLGARRNITNQRWIARGIQKIARAHELSCLQFAGDVEHRFAFAHRERLLVDLTARELPEDLAARHGMIEKVFAGLQRPLRMPPRVDLKRQSATNHAICFEQMRYVPAGSSARHIDEDAFRRKALVWFRDAIPDPCRGASGNQHDQKQ